MLDCIHYCNTTKHATTHRQLPPYCVTELLVQYEHYRESNLDMSLEPSAILIKTQLFFRDTPPTRQQDTSSQRVTSVCDIVVWDSWVNIFLCDNYDEIGVCAVSVEMRGMIRVYCAVSWLQRTYFRLYHLCIRSAAFTIMLGHMMRFNSYLCFSNKA